MDVGGGEVSDDEDVVRGCEGGFGEEEAVVGEDLEAGGGPGMGECVGVVLCVCPGRWGCGGGRGSWEGDGEEFVAGVVTGDEVENFAVSREL